MSARSRSRARRRRLDPWAGAPTIGAATGSDRLESIVIGACRAWAPGLDTIPPSHVLAVACIDAEADRWLTLPVVRGLEGPGRIRAAIEAGDRLCAERGLDAEDVVIVIGVDAPGRVIGLVVERRSGAVAPINAPGGVA